MTEDRPRRAAPAYRGRRLARPGADLADQGLGFDLGTLLHRRQLLRVLGLGAAGLGVGLGVGLGAGLGLVACGHDEPDEIAQETAGPFPGDGSNGPDVLERSGIVRGDIRSSFGTGGATAQGVQNRVVHCGYQRSVKRRL